MFSSLNTFTYVVHAKEKLWGATEQEKFQVEIHRFAMHVKWLSTDNI
jgi:hypothetical protein